jgi:hypothetical protein
MFKYLAFYPLEFLNDPRVARLTTKEKQQFLYLLIFMSTIGAVLSEDHREISRIIDSPLAATKTLISKLTQSGLLIRTGTKLFELSSPRLTKECDKAIKAYNLATETATSRANARWNKIKKEDVCN